MAPTPIEYGRMVERNRRAAVVLARTEHDLIEAAAERRRARVEETRTALRRQARTETAALIAEATALLPQIVAAHGDTPTLQAARCAAMQD
ncbi:hypothetical protein [Xylanimonas protaetiae]|uniref:Uncharacterized protein n=1 Tax=Xylanimonas protaetiae TaxID=2509457 RepID=A0A4P6F9K1_9MICO|nr:hypothetical protein [Xylanimonas protaetiae]QAY70047.1 hypothetical protein ET471_08365 [Xylanimonas protaetiae]